MTRIKSLNSCPPPQKKNLLNVPPPLHLPVALGDLKTILLADGVMDDQGTPSGPEASKHSLGGGGVDLEGVPAAGPGIALVDGPCRIKGAGGGGWGEVEGGKYTHAGMYIVPRFGLMYVLEVPGEQFILEIVL